MVEKGICECGQPIFKQNMCQEHWEQWLAVPKFMRQAVNKFNRDYEQSRGVKAEKLPLSDVEKTGEEAVAQQPGLRVLEGSSPSNPPASLPLQPKSQERKTLQGGASPPMATLPSTLDEIPIQYHSTAFTSDDGLNFPKRMWIEKEDVQEMVKRRIIAETKIAWSPACQDERRMKAIGIIEAYTEDFNVTEEMIEDYKRRVK